MSRITYLLISLSLFTILIGPLPRSLHLGTVVVCAQANGCGDCANHTIYQQFPDGYIEMSACDGPTAPGGPAPCWWMNNVGYNGYSEYSYIGAGGTVDTICVEPNGDYRMC